MKKLIFFMLILSYLFLAVALYAEDFIVYTAHQSFDSRIYILRMDGSIYNYYEYSDVRFCGLEVVNNEVYVAEAFCPLVYKVDLYTGNLETIIFDLSLFYCYDVCFDGTYFYLDEWDLNRYDINGNKDGTASFDEYVLGAAWDGEYYWTLNDTNEIRCWNITGWPTITEIPANAFTPPTPDCRGLWFDGQYFWTGESIESTLGNIYQFDYTGAIINQWLEPSFRGWGACVVYLTGIDEQAASPHNQKSLVLSSIYPNPFLTYTTITYSIPKSDWVKLTVYNILGQRVKTLVDGVEQSGKKSFVWSGTNERGESVISGIYIIRLESGRDIQVRKLLLID